MKITITFKFFPKVTTLNLLLDCVKRMIAIAGCEEITWNKEEI